MVCLKRLLQRRDLRRDMDDIWACPVRLQHEMIIFIIPCLHRLKSVSMVGMFQSQDHRSLFIPAVHVVLKRHFQCNLDCHTAGIREETVVQISRQPGCQLFRKFSRRLMGQSAEHDVGKLFYLRDDRLVDDGILISMDHAPPGGNGIDHFLILCIQVHPVCVHDLVRCLHCL